MDLNMSSIKDFTYAHILTEACVCAAKVKHQKITQV